MEKQGDENEERVKDGRWDLEMETWEGLGVTVTMMTELRVCTCA